MASYIWGVRWPVVALRSAVIAKLLLVCGAEYIPSRNHVHHTECAIV